LKGGTFPVVSENEDMAEIMKQQEEALRFWEAQSKPQNNLDIIPQDPFAIVKINQPKNNEIVKQEQELPFQYSKEEADLRAIFTEMGQKKIREALISSEGDIDQAVQKLLMDDSRPEQNKREIKKEESKSKLIHIESDGEEELLKKVPNRNASSDPFAFLLMNSSPVNQNQVKNSSSVEGDIFDPFGSVQYSDDLTKSELEFFGKSSSYIEKVEIKKVKNEDKEDNSTDDEYNGDDETDSTVDYYPEDENSVDFEEVANGHDDFKYSRDDFVVQDLQMLDWYQQAVDEQRRYEMMIKKWSRKSKQ